ncbi:MAG: DUF350 domain-containing protein [Acidobacteria bacterium]|nr:DUF350 domain-containing protein [Acidobacteriota bacterium]
MSLPFDPAPILLALTQVVLGVVMLIVARLIKNLLSPYGMDRELTTRDNPAFGLPVAGYYGAVACVYVGAVRANPVPLDAGTAGALQALGFDFAWAAGGILALTVSRWVMDWALITGARVSDEIIRNRNIGAGAVEAGVYIASGLVLSGAIRQPGGSVLTTCVFFALSQMVLIALGRLYQRLAGYDVAKEIQTGNLAAGTAFSLTLIALSLLMLKATSGDFVGWGPNLTYFAFDSVSGFVLLIALRWLTDLALLPGARISEEIVRDRNVNVGLVEGVLAVGVAGIILFVF